MTVDHRPRKLRRIALGLTASVVVVFGVLAPDVLSRGPV